MTSWIRSLLIRVVTPWSWRSRRRLAASLNRFSQTEADSAWQMLQALEAVDVPEFQVELFNNALEEVHHAAIFGRLAQEYADAPLPLVAPPRTKLFNARADLAGFEALHYVGESEVYRQFLAYARSAPDEPVRSAFLEIRGDEEGHQRLAYQELIKLAGSERAARRLIRRVRWRRFKEAAGRASRALGDLMLSVLLGLVYYTIGGPFAPMCRRRLVEMGGPGPGAGEAIPAVTAPMRSAAPSGSPPG